jgi:hypothetical protein
MNNEKSRWQRLMRSNANEAYEWRDCWDNLKVTPDLPYWVPWNSTSSAYPAKMWSTRKTGSLRSMSSPTERGRDVGQNCR